MANGKLLVAEKDGVHVLKFVGDVRVTLGPTIDAFLTSLLETEDFKSVIIDLTETKGIDSTSLGFLAKISIGAQDSFGIVPTIVSTNDDITRILLSMGFDQVFLIIREPLESTVKMGEVPFKNMPEEDLRKKVLEAHQVLMQLNEDNQNTFRDLVVALQREQESSTVH
ncbi:MAG: STAS domain-containing protein [Gammaproteobacteria bacterium]|nr:STAS domain-containing protein [Gammaproteobacteria bacterium]